MIATVNNIFRKYPVAAYFFLAYAFTWVISLPLALSVRGVIAFNIPHELEMVAAFGPFAAALLLAWLLDGRAGIAGIFAGLKRWRVGRSWLLFSLLSPFVLLFCALLFIRLSSGSFSEFGSDASIRLLTIAGLLDLIVVGGLIQGFGEEPGWRGFALPRLLHGRGLITASLMLFPFWLCWHLPSFLARPEFGLPQFLGFGLGILSATMWLTLIWVKTQSILMAALWHALINVARNIALAISMPLFLTINMTVTLGAAIIVLYWLFSANRGQPLNEAGNQ